MHQYPIPVDQWDETPIKREHNPNTGFLEGEDDGYRNVSTLKANPEPMVVPDVETRAIYDGDDLYDGSHNPKNEWEGGLEGRVQVVREMVARALDEMQRIMDEHSAGELKLVLLDGFRSGPRQSAGFRTTLHQVLQQRGLKDPTVTQLYGAARTANGTFSWVAPDTNSPQYAAAMNALKADRVLGQEVEAIARQQLQEGQQLSPESVDKIFADLIAISVNGRMGPAKDFPVPLNCENSSHSGGGAVDVMMTYQGSLAEPVPFDWVGKEASMDYMEDPAHFDEYKAEAARNPALREHLTKLGFEKPESFTWRDWELMRNVLRIRYHLLKSCNGTYYSAHDSNEGGENWHIEPDGVLLYGPDGNVISRSALADRFQSGSGNPGHTIQKLGRGATAVYGGGSAHEIARRDFGLAA